MSDESKGHMTGSHWRLRSLQESQSRSFENVGVLDEFVVDQWLHLENMDETTWWMRIGDVRIVITDDGSNAPTVDIQRGAYGTPKGKTTTWDPKMLRDRPDGSGK